MQSLLSPVGVSSSFGILSTGAVPPVKQEVSLVVKHVFRRYLEPHCQYVVCVRLYRYHDFFSENGIKIIPLRTIVLVVISNLFGCFGEN